MPGYKRNYYGYGRAPRTKLERQLVGMRRKQYNKKKRYYSKRQANAKFYGASMSPTVQNLKQKFTSRYVEVNRELTWTAGGTIPYHAYWANGLWDPRYELGGHKVVGFDQIMQFYDHYTVIAAKIKITIENQSDQHACIVALQVSDDGATIGNNMNTIIENGAVAYKKLTRQGTDGTFQQNGGSTCVLTKKCGVKKFMGRPNILSEDDLRGTDSSNPNEGVFFKLALVGGLDGSVDAITIRYIVQIDYVAILTEPKLVIGS